jgi:DNA primase
MGYFTDDFLRKLRNKVNINEVIGALRLETRRGTETDLLRFHCPLCHGFHTGTNPKTNLARCFDCKVNFNPIDLVIATTGCNFIDSVEFLKKQIHVPKSEG